MIQVSENTRQQIADLCRRYNIRELSLFGSRARGDARPDSDYDLVVEFRPDAGISILEFSRIQIDLEDLIGHKVDLVPKDGLKRLIREHVLAEARPLYED